MTRLKYFKYLCDMGNYYYYLPPLQEINLIQINLKIVYLLIILPISHFAFKNTINELVCRYYNQSAVLGIFFLFIQINLEYPLSYILMCLLHNFVVFYLPTPNMH